LLIEIPMPDPDGAASSHPEVETCTWDVRPAQLRAGHRTGAIAREPEWVLKELS
jgi:hypothetical protein